MKEANPALVTELMKCSLKSLLLDQSQPLTWQCRLLFALDVAHGVSYLHEKGLVHRDLKADNCFVGNDFRVKVADFGTGRIIANFEESRKRHRSTDSRPLSNVEYENSTLSKGSGTLLWMAPEALLGNRVKQHDGPALDVYSYAIVLWEIWTRSVPWLELNEVGIQFNTKLVALVSDGVRPRRTPQCGDAPKGYQELMEECWSSLPTHRPTFTAIVTRMTDILESTRVLKTTRF